MNKWRAIAALFLAYVDLLGCLLVYVLIAVNPVHAKTDGLRPPAQYLVTMEWPIALDSDIDLWVIGPTRKPVFYGSRQVGCADLDHDDVGFATSRITLADGSVVNAVAHKEVTSIRCIEPGRWDIASNLFSDRGNAAKGIPVHVEIVGLNPSVTTLFSGDLILNHYGQSTNVVSFDLDRDGKMTLAEPPLESVLNAYAKSK